MFGRPTKFGAWWKRLGRSLSEREFKEPSRGLLASTLRRLDSEAASSARGPLDALETKILSALVSCMGPDDDSVPMESVLASIESYLLSLPKHKGSALRDLLLIFDQWPLLTRLKSQRFTTMPRDEQDEFLESLASSTRSRERSLYLALRTPVMLALWSQESAWAIAGYSAPSGDLSGADMGEASATAAAQAERHPAQEGQR